MAPMPSKDPLLFLINTIAFPRRLPAVADNFSVLADHLFCHIHQSADSFRESLAPDFQEEWTHVCNALKASREVHVNGCLSSSALEKVFAMLDSGSVFLYVKEQNAGLIVRKSELDEYVFEAFEASPRSEDVLASGNALLWSFPGIAVAVKASEFHSVSFRQELSKLLETASAESVKRFVPIGAKGALETRDTTNPELITHCLMTMLQACGRRASPIQFTHKRVHDDVLWTDGSELPWRRSPLYLVARVFLQRCLMNLYGEEVGRSQYKYFVSFLLARLIGSTLNSTPACRGVNCETMAFMRSKLARRLTKLEMVAAQLPETFAQAHRSISKAVDPHFQSVLATANVWLEKTVQSARTTATKQVSTIPREPPVECLNIRLKNSGNFFFEALAVPPKRTAFGAGTLEESSARLLFDTAAFPTPAFRVSKSGAPYLELFDFEAWAGRGLSDWTQHNQPSDGTCAKIAAVAELYKTVASNAYQNNAERLSKMVLTLFELWMALDQHAVALCPMLIDYTSGLTETSFESLRFETSEDVGRASAIETYLVKRNSAADPNLPHIFADPANTSFASTYFEACSAMTSLHVEIKLANEEAMCQKENEWREKSVEYESLMLRARAMTCIYLEDNVSGQRFHQSDCTKCKLLDQGQRMRIAVAEALLPDELFEAKSVIFELLCPKFFIHWRDITWMLHFDLGSAAGNQQVPKLLLRNYKGLVPYHRSSFGRVSLASRAKSFTSTHYKTVHLPAPLEQVCLPHPLKLAAYDARSSTWTHRLFRLPDFTTYGNSVLPSTDPYFVLRRLKGPNPNLALATQGRASQLQPLEYIVISELLWSDKLFWTVLLRELSSANVQFNAAGAVSIICGAVLRIGPFDKNDHSRIRDWPFSSDEFCHRLLQCLSGRITATENNWKELRSTKIAVTILLKLWTSTVSPAIRESTADLVRRVRQTALTWARKLRHEIMVSTDEGTQRLRQNEIIGAVQLCHRTFELEAVEIPGSLTPESASTYIETSIYAQENRPELTISSSQACNDATNSLELNRRLEDQLRATITTTDALHRAIDATWPGYRTYSTPMAMTVPRSHWIHCSTVATDEIEEIPIHYSMETGTLLISGSALGQLPTNYLRHPLYKSVFGQTTRFAYPSEMPGMTHCLVERVAEHTIHFGVRSGKLIMRVSKQRRTYELIPSNIFRSRSAQVEDDDIPLPLIDGSIHWLNTSAASSGIVEIRPFHSRWETQGTNWQLDVVRRRLEKPGQHMIDSRSPIFDAIVSVIQPFEKREHILAFKSRTGRTAVSLPRFDLVFEVNDSGLLRCAELASVIDDNQDVGTFHGLKSMLVLKAENNEQERSALVPLVLPAIVRDGYHVSVSTITQESTVRYCRFSIDQILGRLTSTFEPRIVYYQALFHALTSFVVPDKLTKVTGIEEALNLLRSALAQPWRPLDSMSMDILKMIMTLTPARTFYPQNLRCMQRVEWNSQFSEISQHDELASLVSQIFKRHSDLQPFFPDTNLLTVVARGEQFLTARAVKRLRLCQAPQVGDITKLSIQKDSAYDARHTLQWNLCCAQVFEVATRIRNWEPTLPLVPNMIQLFSDCPIIGGFHEPFEPGSLDATLHGDVFIQWGSLFSLCQRLTQADQYRALYLFSLMAYRTSGNMEAIRILISCLVVTRVATVSLPPWPSYSNFFEGHRPSIDGLVELMAPARSQYPEDARASVPHLAFKVRRKLELAEEGHNKEADIQLRALAKALLVDWPCAEPKATDYPVQSHVDVCMAISLIQEQWTRFWQNHHLHVHLQETQSALKTYDPPTSTRPTKTAYACQMQPDHYLQPKLFSLPSFEDLLTYPRPACHFPHTSFDQCQAREGKVLSHTGGGAGLAADLITTTTRFHVGPASRIAIELGSGSTDRRKHLDELCSIVRPLLSSGSLVRSNYGKDLLCSIEAFRSSAESLDTQVQFPDPVQLEILISDQRSSISAKFQELLKTFNQDVKHQWLQLGDISPRVTIPSLLASISSRSHTTIDPEVKENVVALALKVTHLQRLTRIAGHARKSKHQMLREELLNPGHTNWDPKHHTDWLLLEIDGNFLIREDQCEVAKAMIRPPSGQSSTLQLNMGRGKSSVIIPMVCCSLADSKHLVRVVIPKPLLSQAASVLVPRLGRLLGRTILHVPFSRRTTSDATTVGAFLRLHRTCAEESGITLALPEHLMSFRLSGQQVLSSGSLNNATALWQAQTWLDENSRDVLDESDFILNPRTQLIYPSGVQVGLDAQRWKIVEAVLHLVKLMLPELRSAQPNGIEIAQHPNGGYPAVFILRREAEVAMLDQLACLISRGHGGILPLMSLRAEDQENIRLFLRSERVAKGMVSRLRLIFEPIPDGWNNLLLVRGLLVYRLLALCLAKRYNVHYGLHSSRPPVAVPFTAKGVPTENSEFGHIDVTILLSCLSFYNAGLELEQFKRCIMQMLRTDDPGIHWDTISKRSPSLPAWNNVNPDDELQCASLWDLLKHSTPLIDFYLNQEIFPRYCRVYEQKLVSNGWDLLAAADRESVVHDRPTTGFSGTSDGKYILPLNIQQRDLSVLAGTNAEVLSYLLQPRNRSYLHIADRTVKGLLERVSRMQPPIKTILDAGAMIRELTNKKVVTLWLQIKASADAAVFFDETDRIMVLHHDGRSEPLGVSPFSEKLDNCLVYLDEAHTRGTDLKFPMDARAIVTLGPGQTKDHTVQAAMRLRHLGTTQSIVFVAPPEVDFNIRDVTQKTLGDRLNSCDVVTWLLEKTCVSIENLLPLHISQGREFCRREVALLDNKEATSDEWQRGALLKELVRKEDHSLKALYEPKAAGRTHASIPNATATIEKYLAELQVMQSNLSEASLSSAVQGRVHDEIEVEVEVEAEIEAEAVREIQKTPIVDAFAHSPLHRDVLRFVEIGDLVSKSSAYSQVFEAIYKTSTGKQLSLLSEAYKSQLFVSHDFMRTVVPTGVRTPDDYLRPVNWFLWSGVSKAAIVISPFEADQLIDVLRTTHLPRTHLICYAAPIVRNMLVFNEYPYSIPLLPTEWKMPPWLVLDLGFLAGRLYFEFTEYRPLCARFGIHTPDAAQDRDQAIFSTTALPFLHDWLTLRRKNQEWSHTPMGLVCRARLLTQDLPFFAITRDRGRQKQAIGTQQERETSYDAQVVGGQLEFCAENPHEPERTDLVQLNETPSEHGVTTRSSKGEDDVSCALDLKPLSTNQSTMQTPAAKENVRPAVLDDTDDDQDDLLPPVKA